MRVVKLIAVASFFLFLSACVSSLLIGNQVQSKLMWSFLKPLVGFDPNEVNLFETPIVKNRMTSLLGDKYEPTMALLRTAQEVQQEGALFYVASRYAPPKVQEITDKAAMIWNADTNQMAVMLIKDGTPAIMAEQAEGAKQTLIPALPRELQHAYDQAKSAKAALNEQQNTLKKAQEALADPVGAVTVTASKKVSDEISSATQKATQKTTKKLKTIPHASLPSEQEVLDVERAMKKEREELQQKMQ